MIKRTIFIAGDPLAGMQPAPPPKGIPFTQHLMPDGRLLPQWFEHEPEIEARAFALIELGCSFHVEMLRDRRTVSLAVEWPGDEQVDIAIQLCLNGPDIPNGVERLIARAESYFARKENDHGNDQPVAKDHRGD